MSHVQHEVNKQILCLLRLLHFYDCVEHHVGHVVADVLPQKDVSQELSQHIGRLTLVDYVLQQIEGLRAHTFVLKREDDHLLELFLRGRLLNDPRY